jgi:hypothetical protein
VRWCSAQGIELNSTEPDLPGHLPMTDRTAEVPQYARSIRGTASLIACEERFAGLNLWGRWPSAILHSVPIVYLLKKGLGAIT